MRQNQNAEKQKNGAEILQTKLPKCRKQKTQNTVTPAAVYDFQLSKGYVVCMCMYVFY